MKDIPTRFGFPDTLAPLGSLDIRHCFRFAGMGFLVLMIGLFPSLRPPPHTALPVALCLLALSALGLFKFLRGKSRSRIKSKERTTGTSAQVGLYTLVMVSVGCVFYFWAKHLGVKPSVILGSLLLIEGLGCVIVSFTEWWRLSHIGVALGLMVGGLLVPLVDKVSIAVPVGASFLIGSLASAAILYWQVRNHEVSAASPTA